MNNFNILMSNNILPTCPITGQHIKDPVSTPDGNTYEREAIEHWLQINNTEPQTRNRLSISQLIPNRALKDMYDQIYNPVTSPIINPIINSVNSPIINPVTDTTTILNLDIMANKTDNEYNVLFKIESPETLNESFHDIVLCIDTSGSMSSSADKPQSEQSGLSILDILKYSAKVIIKSGNEKQRIGIVKFSNEGKIIRPLTVLDESGKDNLIESLELLSPDGQTNLYDGIIKSWELFETSTCKKKSIILFTDGEPNMEPPRGYVPQLQNIKEKKYNGQYISDINIYTYGNNVNSELSDNISRETNGVYGFIPDSVLMGDLLIHKMAALRSTKTKNALLKIEFGTNVCEIIVSDSINHLFISSSLLLINVGDVLDESSRNFVLKIKTNNFELPIIYASLEYEDQKIEQSEVHLINTNDIEYNILRQESIVFLSDIIKISSLRTYPNKFDVMFNDFILKLTSYDPRIISLKDTFNEQVKLSYTILYYSKWGRHYLLSLRRALQMEQCNNYKDKCVQHFGKTLFNKILDEVDDIFTRLPPPRPSKIITRTNNLYSNVSLTSQPVINMSNYISRNNPCFHGLSKVKMADLTLKNVNQIQKDDLVLLGNNQIGIIQCVLKTIIEENIDMISLNDLHITPYHPVKINNKWYYPKDLEYAKKSELECNEIFSFILKDKRENGIIINDYECATLGHNINEPIIRHSFFGTELVINNLKESSNYNLGLILLNQNCMIRNERTDLIERIII